MLRGVGYGLVLVLSLSGGNLPASAFDQRIDAVAVLRTGFAFAPMAAPVAHARAADVSETSMPAEYAAAMTWYRMAMANGFDAPVVASPWLHGEELPEPLRWSWQTGNGDLINRVGRGAFRLSFEDNNANWFRELNCWMVVWPGGDLQAKIECEDGTQRTMLIPEEGGLVLDGVAYQRAFRLRTVGFDEAGGEVEGVE
jgi:hypothetical protein